MPAMHDGADARTRAVALAGIRSGKSMREIAAELYGSDEVTAGWHGDSRMRAKVQWLVQRAQAASDDANPGTP